MERAENTALVEAIEDLTDAINTLAKIGMPLSDLKSEVNKLTEAVKSARRSDPHS